MYLLIVDDKLMAPYDLTLVLGGVLKIETTVSSFGYVC